MSIFKDYLIIRPLDKHDYRNKLEELKMIMVDEVEIRVLEGRNTEVISRHLDYVLSEIEIMEIELKSDFYVLPCGAIKKINNIHEAIYYEQVYGKEGFKQEAICY